MDTVSFKSRRAKTNHQQTSHETEAQEGPEIDRQALAELWQAVLRADSVDPEDNFFELGGTSLHAMLLASRVDKQLAAEVSLVAFFENPTFAGLCDSVTRKGSE